jgi:DNA-binding NtrC family response regulator
VPALRERVNDIPVLVDYFGARQAARTGKKIRQIENRSLQIMKQYSWPGNIRELQNVIERCVILAAGEVLRVDPTMLMYEPPAAVSAPAMGDGGSDRKSKIETVLRETRGKFYGPKGAAARLGVPGTTLESQIRSLGIKKYFFK